MTETITLASKANVDTSHAAEVIQQTYRQVFGNRHMMELDINNSIEALFMNGDITVQGMVTALAESETYKKLYLEPNSPYRFVELNFKHLLGRPPRDQTEVMEHVRLLQDEGYEAEIASYTYSEEYLVAFGVDQVPHNRANSTMVGGNSLPRFYAAGYCYVYASPAARLARYSVEWPTFRTASSGPAQPPASYSLGRCLGATLSSEF